MKTIEEWAEEKKTPAWLLAAAKAANKWGEGKKVEESTFDNATEKVGNIKMLAYAPAASTVRIPGAAHNEEPAASMAPPADSQVVPEDHKKHHH